MLFVGRQTPARERAPRTPQNRTEYAKTAHHLMAFQRDEEMEEKEDEKVQSVLATMVAATAAPDQ